MNMYSSTGLERTASLSVPVADRGWPPTPGKLRLVMVDSEVLLRQTAGNLGAILGTLRVGQEADVVGIKKADGQKWVAVALPDGRRGFISGATKTRTFRNVTLKTDSIDMFAKPGDPSSVIRQMTRGERFM